MTIQILSQEPASLIAGTSARWKRSSRDYPPSADWVLTYYFATNAENGNFAIVATTSAEGDWFEATAAPATTTGLPTGFYDWQAIVSNGTDIVQIASGRLNLKPSLAKATAPVDTRSQVKKTLDAINEAIHNKVLRDRSTFTIGDRAIQHIPLTELMALQTQYTRWYEQEQMSERAKKGSPFKYIDVRFKRP